MQSKQTKRLNRYLRLAHVRGMNWAMKHIDREGKNARRSYRQIMGKNISVKLARAGLFVAFMLRYDPKCQATLATLLNASPEELSA